MRYVCQTTSEFDVMKVRRVPRDDALLLCQKAFCEFCPGAGRVTSFCRGGVFVGHRPHFCRAVSRFADRAAVNSISSPQIHARNVPIGNWMDGQSNFAIVMLRALDLHSRVSYSPSLITGLR